MSQTHSHLSFDELCEEAFGEIGLHPWEFYQYDLPEYLLKRSGAVKRRRRELKEGFQQVQVLAYYSILPYLPKNASSKKIDELIPNIYDDTPAVVVSLKDQYEKIKEKYKHFGVLKTDNGS